MAKGMELSNNVAGKRVDSCGNNCLCRGMGTPNLGKLNSVLMRHLTMGEWQPPHWWGKGGAWQAAFLDYNHPVSANPFASSSAAVAAHGNPQVFIVKGGQGGKGGKPHMTAACQLQNHKCFKSYCPLFKGVCGGP